MRDVDPAGALEAVDRILNRGGEATGVLRDVLAALHERGVESAAIRIVVRGELGGGPAVGPAGAGLRREVVYEGMRVGELELAIADEAFAERVATLISPYVHALAASGAAIQ